MRRISVAVVLLAATAACSAEPIPPVPEHLRSLTEQESSCIACHSRGRAPSLEPGETTTPRAHPSIDAEAMRALLGGG